MLLLPFSINSALSIFSAFYRVEGVILSAPKRLVAQRAGTDGHADRFWALALACAAASTPVEHFAYEPVSPYDDADDDFYGNRYSIKAQRGLL